MSSHKSSGRLRARLPRNYLMILEAIEATHVGEHLTAQDVYVRARTARPTIGFATVHRALARLHELGQVEKVDVPGAASAVYERIASPHAHFRCERCGTIRDIAFSVAPELRDALAALHGLQIATESTTFVGSCARCAAA
jgi:Fur family peroxide stress response transcriptional regulator